LAEHEDGRFEIINWSDTGAERPLPSPRLVEQDQEAEIAA
jgi:hypothetical protein